LAETVGTIAGDDAILIVCPDRNPPPLAARIQELLA